MQTLLVEDDSELAMGIQGALIRAGFGVRQAASGREAKSALAEQPGSLVVLDLGLPDMSGIEVLSWMRSSGYTIPVLALTVNDALDEKVRALDLGADDCLAKPFELPELVARAQALVRRSEGTIPPLILHGNLELDTVAHRARFENRDVALTGREFAILHELLRNTGRILSRGDLEERLYGWGQEIESNAVEVHIHHLRRKFSRNLIRTVRGVGYTVRREDA